MKAGIPVFISPLLFKNPLYLSYANYFPKEDIFSDQLRFPQLP